MAKSLGSRSGNDRKDGRLLRTLGGFARFLPFVMTSRNDAFNLYEDDYEVTESDRWIKAQRGKGYKSMGLLHLLIAAYVRVIAALPGMNRFVAGRRIYARSEIEVSMLVKRGNTIDAGETSVKVAFEPSDTVYDVYRKVNDALDKVRDEDDGNDTDGFASFLANSPRFVTRILMWIMRALDYLGLLPEKIISISPLHSSMMISDMSYMGGTPMYHHIYNVGTLPVYISFGARQHMEDVDDSGNAIDRKFIEARFAVDGRTVDTHYYAAAFKLFKRFIENPAQLEVPPVKVNDDVY